MRTRLYLILPVAMFAAGPALATSSALADGISTNAIHLVQYRSLAPRLGSELIPQIVPQYNTPGPQVAVPQAGDPVLQQAPLGTTSPPPGSPVAQLPPLGTTINPLEQPPLAGTTIP